MNLRDHFAGIALPCVNHAENKVVDAARLAYIMADAMLVESGLQPGYIKDATDAARRATCEQLLKALRLLRARYQQMGKGRRWIEAAKTVSSIINTIENVRDSGSGDVAIEVVDDGKEPEG